MSSPSSLMYHCRMQYLKSRDGQRPKPKSRRRTSTINIFEVGEKSEEPTFSCLDEKVHGPCTPEILLPPPELTTRPRAFKQAYWKHHSKPAVRAVERLEIYHPDERKERLNKKRADILAKIRSKEKVRLLFVW